MWVIRRKRFENLSILFKIYIIYIKYSRSEDSKTNIKQYKFLNLI